MRVCLISAEYPPQQGGVGDYTHELAVTLRQQGVDAFVLTGGAASPEDANGPVPVERCIDGWGWGAWRSLGTALGRLAPDVVHIQYQSAAYGLHPAINLWPRSSAWGRRTVVTFHDLRVPYLFPKAGPLRFRTVIEMARGAARAIVTNVEDESTLQRYLARPPALIPIGSNIKPAPPAGYDRTAWRARVGISTEDIALAYFGFLNESKGGEELVEGLALLRQRHLPAHLWLVGGQVGDSDPTNQAYLARVRERISALGVEPYVYWTGYTTSEEVSAYLLAADLCVLPYRDGVSFRRGSLMAALAHGLPVVSTYPRQPLVQIVEDRNMALVPAEDAPALATRLAALIADPGARARLAGGALELSAEFGWERIAERTVEVYDALA